MYFQGVIIKILNKYDDGFFRCKKKKICIYVNVKCLYNKCVVNVCDF